MSETPLRISVVTVCRNSAGTIGDTLASVAAQLHPAVEHIVVDGCSTDGTQSLVRAAPHVERFVSEPDAGIYDAMNKGLRLASGDVVGFLNADDTYASPGSLATIAAAFGPEVDACYGDLVYVSAGNVRRVVRHWRAGSYRPGLCATGWAPPHPTFYVRRAALLAHGGFVPTMRIAADFELALRLLDVVGLRVRYVPEVLIRMRAGGASNRTVHAVLQGQRELAQALRMHGFPAGWTWSARRLLSRIPQLLQR